MTPTLTPTGDPLVTYDTQVIERLTRVEEKIDNFITRAIDQAVRHDDHEARIRVIEGNTSRMLGIGAVVALIAGSAGPRLLDVLIK